MFEVKYMYWDSQIDFILIADLGRFDYRGGTAQSWRPLDRCLMRNGLRTTV